MKQLSLYSYKIIQFEQFCAAILDERGFERPVKPLTSHNALCRSQKVEITGNDFTFRFTVWQKSLENPITGEGGLGLQQGQVGGQAQHHYVRHEV